jgi:phosphomevalonate kinase
MIDDLRVGKAKNLLNDPLFNEAFDVLKKDLLNRWESSGSTEVEARESIWLAMRLLDRIHAHISSIVETGHMNEILDKQHPFI